MPPTPETPPDLTPEAALLLRCCRPAGGAAADDRDAPLVPNLDWPRFIAMAERNAVMPLVARWALAAAPGQVPPTVMRTLRIAGEACTLRAGRLTRDLLDILARFGSIGIEALAFKGVALSVMAYGDPALRSFTDLDLMIPAARIEDASELLIADGFTCREFNPQFIRSRFFSDNELVFSRTRDLRHVDLHWGLLPDFYPFAAGPEPLWKRAVEIELGGVRVRTPGHEDQILFLCAHAAKHGWNALNRVADVAYLCNSHRAMDWDFVLAEAARMGSRRIVLTGLHLAHSMLGTPLPDRVLAMASADPKVARLAALITRRLLSLEAPYDGPFAEWGVGLGSIEGLHGRARYLWYRLMAPKLSDGALLPLPRGLFPLYYVARPVLLAIKHRSAIVSSRAESK